MDIRPCFLEWYEREHSRLDAVVLDIDGVLIRRGEALPRSNELLAILEKTGKPYSLLTNSADDSIEERCRDLSSAGLRVDPGHVTSCGHALEPYVEKHGLKGSLFYMIARLGDPCYAEEAGLRITRNEDDLDQCRGVIIGEGEVDWQRSINAVANFLRSRPNAHLICPNPDIFFPGTNSTIVIASGGVTRFIVDTVSASGTDIKPIYLGKPYPAIFEYNHRRLEQRAGAGLERGRTVMVGDMVEGDVKGANKFGYISVLLLSGGTNREMLARSTTRPDHIFEAL